MKLHIYTLLLCIIACIAGYLFAYAASAQECYDNGPSIRAHFDQCEWLNDWQADCGPAPGTDEWRNFAYLENDGPSADGSVNRWSLYQQSCPLDLSDCNARELWREVSCICNTCAECYYP